ncbi:hypothetical protein AZE42_12783 [Rhizopogon vesiculosus]|uniref:Uncharacterized protein n=1 Tax=Rhizopogon vesiculosus TaxID=180088 RepID=A0A1J8PPX4_9AGAM|nr:hypothetical protein AZE42_12783 [Rhizopogon vesiculosus]
MITSYFYCVLAIPLITQSDPGSENFAVANAQTMIHHRLDPALDGTLQHHWMDFTPGFETILEEGITTGIYDVHNTLQNYVFRWLAIPWLQAELDAWVHRRNHNAPRRDKHKILPHSIPAIIRAKPHEYNSLDFKV